MAGSISKARNFAIYDGLDPREIPSYGTAEAGHYLGIPLATLRSWVGGRYYPTRKGRKHFKPVLSLPDKALPLLSFINLVEAHVLDAIRQIHRVPLKNVRSAIEYLMEKSKYEHPLAEPWFQTDGLNLFIQESDRLINVSQKGQFAMREIIKAYLRRVERDEAGLAQRLYPFTRKLRLGKLSEDPKIVVIDPMISFGKPSLARVFPQLS